MGDHWKSLADKLGAPGMDEPTPAETDSTPVSEAPYEQPQASPAAAPVEPRREIVAAPEIPAAKPKKKSSWEALASIFNIRVEPEPLPPEPLVSEPADNVTETRSSKSFTEAFRSESKPQDKHLHVFPESHQDRSNPALEQMFADAPRGDLDDVGQPGNGDR